MNLPRTTILILLSSACAPVIDAARAAPPDPPLHVIMADDLCVTNGTIAPLPNGHLVVDTPSSRAVLRYHTVPVAEIRFRYLGSSAGSKPLASGELRRQIGIKLVAQDTCNLLYAMWHIEPDSKIAVSIKRNPGMTTHEQCGASGYINMKPSAFVPLPRIASDRSHTFRAELHNTDVTVIADGAIVWQGNLGTQTMDISGPVGLRTDNARFEFEYFAGARAPSTGAGERAGACAQTPGD
jgi:hypothetical protein